MAKRKKRNNLVQHRDWFYCRLRWYNQFGRQVECKVNLFTKNKGDAINRAKRVLKEIENIIKIVRTASDSIEMKITDAIKSTRTLNGNYFYKQLGETLK